MRAVNGEEVATVAGLKAALARRTERWRIGVERGGKSLKLVIDG